MCSKGPLVLTTLVVMTLLGIDMTLKNNAKLISRKRWLKEDFGRFALSVITLAIVGTLLIEYLRPQDDVAICYKFMMSVTAAGLALGTMLRIAKIISEQDPEEID